MARTVLLNNIDHQSLKVAARGARRSADNVNQALLFPTEIAEAQRELPIFFRKDAKGRLQAVALLGLDKGENLFLDETGWRTRYIPAVLERGPFLIGFQERPAAIGSEPEPMIYVDLDDPALSESEGEPLFLPHGGASPRLERIARVLRLIHQGTELAEPLYSALDDAGLITPATVEIKLTDRRSYALPNLYTIDAERLSALDGATLERLNRPGYLAAALHIVSSLGNVSWLIELKRRKLRAEGGLE